MMKEKARDLSNSWRPSAVNGLNVETESYLPFSFYLFLLLLSFFFSLSFYFFKLLFRITTKLGAKRHVF